MQLLALVSTPFSIEDIGGTTGGGTCGVIPGFAENFNFFIPLFCVILIGIVFLRFMHQLREPLTSELHSIKLFSGILATVHFISIPLLFYFSSLVVSFSTAFNALIPTAHALGCAPLADQRFFYIALVDIIGLILLFILLAVLRRKTKNITTQQNPRVYAKKFYILFGFTLVFWIAVFLQFVMEKTHPYY